MRPIFIFASLPLVASLAFFPFSARAQSSADEIHELRVHRSADLAVTFALGAGWIGSEFSKKDLAPDACRWCESIPGIDRGARDRLKWGNTERAGTLSDGLDFAVLPVLMLGADALLASQHGALKNSPDDALIILQAAMAASALNQIVKFTAGRERPFVHALATPEEKAAVHDAHDNNLSFYSGHTSLAFSLAAATGTVATMRGYKNAWVVWPVGFAAAATVGYLRIAADKHWLTDVATGAVVGGALGALMPLMLHPRRGTSDDALVFVSAPQRREPARIALAFVF